jgi:hypothetical protein
MLEKTIKNPLFQLFSIADAWGIGWPMAKGLCIKKQRGYLGKILTFQFNGYLKHKIC